MSGKLIDMSYAFIANYNIDEHPNPEDFPMHVHDQLEIFMFIDGNAKYLVEGNIYTLEPGDIMIMRQSEAHKIIPEPDKPYERISAHFQPAMLSGLDESLLKPFYSRPLGRFNHFSASDFSTSHYKQCLYTATKYTSDWSGKRVLLLSNIISTLGEINTAFEKKNNEPIIAPIHSTQVKIVEYVNRNLFGDISLENVSEHFFLSVSQLNRIFKQATGSTLWEYVIIKRLLAAREMIINGEQATAACTKCGFTDYSSFYRAYRKKFGVSPKSSQKNS